jgi:hypothetical protein
VVLVVFWFHLQGYIIVGVTEKTLRTALRHALGERGLPHEDRPGSLHIPSEQLDLRLQFNESAGTAYVKVAPARGKLLLRELSRELRRFFASHPIELRKNAFVVYTYIGALLLGLATLYSL